MSCAPATKAQRGPPRDNYESHTSSVIKLMRQALEAHLRTQPHPHNSCGGLLAFEPLHVPDIAADTFHSAETVEGLAHGVVRRVVGHPMDFKLYLRLGRVEAVAAPVLYFKLPNREQLPFRQGCF